MLMKKIFILSTFPTFLLNNISWKINLNILNINYVYIKKCILQHYYSYLSVCCLTAYARIFKLRQVLASKRKQIYFCIKWSARLKIQYIYLKKMHNISPETLSSKITWIAHSKTTNEFLWLFRKRFNGFEYVL